MGRCEHFSIFMPWVSDSHGYVTTFWTTMFGMSDGGARLHPTARGAAGSAGQVCTAALCDGHVTTKSPPPTSQSVPVLKQLMNTVTSVMFSLGSRSLYSLNALDASHIL